MSDTTQNVTNAETHPALASHYDEDQITGRLLVLAALFCGIGIPVGLAAGVDILRLGVLTVLCYVGIELVHAMTRRATASRKGARE